MCQNLFSGVFFFFPIVEIFWKILTRRPTPTYFLISTPDGKIVLNRLEVMPYPTLCFKNVTSFTSAINPIVP